MKIKEILKQASSEVQGLVDQEFTKVNNNPLPGSNLDQAGLKGGREIVLDYLNHGEIGIALEHLLYMVEETGIMVSKDTIKKIVKVSDQLGIKTKLDETQPEDREEFKKP